ncbi:MAG: threonine synthase [Chloroflexi bacterium]|nr:threonine synthase [Chloroflexota bacterium]
MRCTVCGETYAPDSLTYVCPKHGDDGLLETVLAFEGDAPIRPQADDGHPNSMWRYLNLLPIAAERVQGLLAAATPLTSAGWTPLHAAERLGRALGVPHLRIKDDGRNPSASFKDRASAFVVAKALERGETTITTASSGNAGAALACMAASAGMRAVIFVPHTAPQAKVAQLLMFGATVFLVRGTYDDAFDLCLKASRKFGWYCRNTGYNPYTVEGKKTVSFEICEQLDWSAPDRVYVSVGDGNIISGVWKGFTDLHALGWIDRTPKLVGVQAAGSDACYRAWQRARATGAPIQIEPVNADTIADSISVGLPRDGARAVRSVIASGGEFVTVTDDEILRSMKVLASESGVFAEPAGAAGFAGLIKHAAARQVDHDESVVVIVTGNGLKDVPSALKAAGAANVIDPTLEAVERAI